MNYKIQRNLKKNKKVFVIAIIIWIVLSILFSMPVAKSIVESKVNRNL